MADRSPEEIAKIARIIEQGGLISVANEAIRKNAEQKLVEPPNLDVHVRRHPGPELPKKY